VILLTAAAIAAMNSGVKACSAAGRGVDEGVGNNAGKGAGKDVGRVWATMCLMQRELCEPPACLVLHARGGLQVLDAVLMVPICMLGL